jgi:magnesium chelatase family protein
VGITGGGKYPIPGEISLAHNGVLFLDELPYFKKTALEVLRQPLEDGEITISRSLTTHTFPAKFMLVAAMNPCEDSIGIKKYQYHNCTESQRRHYYSKISKPLLDRIDLQIEVKKVKIEEITSTAKSESSKEIRARVAGARRIQLQRFENLKHPIFANGQMANKEIKRFCPLTRQNEDLMNSAVDRLNLSARSYFKILKIARTIADLENAPEINAGHLQEALQYRTLDVFRI